MNGIDDLRRILDEHAPARDDQLAGRAAAIRARVRGVRRRRAAVVAAAAAVVVLGGSVLTRQLDAPTLPVARTLAGATAPGTMSSLGYTYRFADAAQGTRTVELDVAASSRPRLVTWATSGSDDTVAVTVPDGEPVSWDGADFSRWTILPAGPGGTVTARVGAGEVALAAYDLTDARPAGVTEHGVTFRDVVADRRLLAAAVGARGETSVQLPAAVVGASTTASWFCSGAPKGAWLSVVVDGEDVAAGGCDQGVAPVDAVDGNSFGLPTTSGDRVVASVRVTAGEDGPPIEDDDLQAGLGLYDAPSSGTPLGAAGGPSFPGVVESDGHRWRLDDTTSAPPGTDRLDTPLPTDRGPLLVSVLADAGGGTDVKVDFGTGHALVDLVGGGGTMRVVGVHAGPVTVRATGATGRLVLGTATYVLADPVGSLTPRSPG